MHLPLKHISKFSRIQKLLSKPKKHLVEMLDSSFHLYKVHYYSLATIRKPFVGLQDDFDCYVNLLTSVVKSQNWCFAVCMIFRIFAKTT